MESKVALGTEMLSQSKLDGFRVGYKNVVVTMAVPNVGPEQRLSIGFPRDEASSVRGGKLEALRSLRSARSAIAMNGESFLFEKAALQ